jgi:glycosyltransferase involved in cell wall biosynthesis
VRAAVHLAREVLPKVRLRVPEARLHLIGRRPAPAVRRLAEPGRVEVTGEVASVAGELARVRVFVAPLEVGRGIPNKILEALAAGRATVVSSWSARALSGEPGRHYLVADGVDERAAAVGDLLADPPRCDALGAAGRDYVAREHDWDGVLRRLSALVADVMRGAADA